MPFECFMLAAFIPFEPMDGEGKNDEDQPICSPERGCIFSKSLSVAASISKEMGLPLPTVLTSPVSALCWSITVAFLQYLLMHCISASPIEKSTSSVVSGARL